VPAGETVLDVGAGEGRYRSLFAHCTYRAHDFAEYQGTPEGLLKDKWEYAMLDYVSDVTDLPVESETIDVVLCTEVLEHVPRPIEALIEMGRVLRPGGTALLSAPLGSGLHQEPYHFYGGFTPHFWHYALDLAGMDVVSIKPNGRFFRLLGQELVRGGLIVRESRRYARLSPVRLVWWCVRSRPVALWFHRLDDKLPVDEFTVGYHVRARKRDPARSLLSNSEPAGSPLSNN
jgi:SAM-dependent methyltransferase